MKAIVYVVAILVAGGAIFLTLSHKKKFEDLQKVRLQTIAENKKASADAAVKEKELGRRKSALAAAETEPRRSDPKRRRAQSQGS